VASGPLVSDPRLPCFGIDRAHAHRSPDPIVAGLLPVGARPPHPLGRRVASLITYPPLPPSCLYKRATTPLPLLIFFPSPFYSSSEPQAPPPLPIAPCPPPELLFRQSTCASPSPSPPRVAGPHRPHRHHWSRLPPSTTAAEAACRPLPRCHAVWVSSHRSHLARRYPHAPPVL
jgi:hypothetical protein